MSEERNWMRDDDIREMRSTMGPIERAEFDSYIATSPENIFWNCWWVNASGVRVSFGPPSGGARLERRLRSVSGPTRQLIGALLMLAVLGVAIVVWAG